MIWIVFAVKPLYPECRIRYTKILESICTSTQAHGSLYRNLIPNEMFCTYYSCISAGLNNSIGPIARNDRRTTVIVGRSCPPNLVYENLGNKRFPASNSCSGTAQLVRSLFWELFCKVTAMLNQLLFTISMLSSSLFSIFLYDQLGIWS